MPSPKSTHIPEKSGGIETVPATGTLVIDTGLRDLQTLTCSLAQDAVATAASTSLELIDQEPGTTRKVTLKTWAADGATPGSTAAKVSWEALGK
jgi:hypothetical protein